MGRGRGSWTGTVALTAALLTTACESPLEVRDGDFTVRAESDRFLVQNRSLSLDAVQVIVEQQAAALIDLVSCEEWSPRLGPGADQTVLFEDVLGYSEQADTAIVYWCLLDGADAVDGGSLTLPFR